MGLAPEVRDKMDSRTFRDLGKGEKASGITHSETLKAVLQSGWV